LRSGTRRLRKFVRLPASERRLLVKAALLLVAIRLGLGLLPFQTLRHLLAQVAEAPTGFRGTNRSSTEGIARAVEVAGRHLPGAGTCLTQALAAEVLLRRQGYPSLLHIGVLRGEEGRLEAHAWLKSGDKVVIGGAELERYMPLALLEGEKQ
jgi:hypothetical protein